MKKIILFGCIFLLILTSLTQISSSNMISGNNIIYVDDDGGADYTKIQDAIDNASDGDGICVYNGIYFENITINKTISVIGSNKYETIIFGNIEISNTENIILKKFTITNNYSGVDFEMSFTNYSNIVDNIFKNMSYGMKIYHSHDNIIADNMIINSNISPIDLFSSNRNFIFNNTMINSCILFQSSYDNIVINNTVNNKPLVYHENNEDITIDYPSGQIALINCSDVTILNQDISDVMTAIQLIDSKEITISNSKITNSYLGISVWMSENITITKSNITNTYLTMLVFFSNNTTILQNQISDSYIGIMAIGTKIKISNNIIKDCNQSILLSSMKNDFQFGGSNEILHNHIENNDYGVIIQHTINENSRVSENNFIKNQIHIQFVILPENFLDFNNIIDHKTDYYPYRFISKIFSIDNYKKDNESSQEFILFNRIYKKNYWDDWIGFGPKIIKGLRWIKNPLRTNSMPIPLPWVCLDWKPASEPYDIPSSEVNL